MVGIAGKSVLITGASRGIGADTAKIFADAGAKDGWADTFRHYLAGQVALAGEMTLFLAPYVNSYKRFQSGSFAPTKVAWSHDNRTAGFRVVGTAH